MLAAERGTTDGYAFVLAHRGGIEPRSLSSTGVERRLRGDGRWHQ
jgi:hypothetical protein